jgi:hypothetical protein
VRAEIDVALEVLGDADALDTDSARAALQHTHASRQELAKLYYQNTSSQGSNYPTV